MNIRSKAPLRLGIAGGGTDVSPYSDTYGGCVLNASINMYSYTFIKNAEPNSVEFSAEDIEVFDRQSLEDPISIKGALPLHRATFKKVMDLYNDGKNHFKPKRAFGEKDVRSINKIFKSCRS